MNAPDQTPDPDARPETEHPPTQEPPSEENPGHGFVSHTSWKRLLLEIVRTYPRALIPLMVAAALPMAPLTLLAQPWDIWLASDSVVVDGARESFVDPLTPVTLASTGVLLLLVLAVSPVVAGAGMLIAGLALLGRRIKVRDAWRYALRRYGTGSGWLLLVSALVMGAAAGSLWALSAEWPPALVGLIVVPSLMVLWPPLMVMLPVALLEGYGPWRAFARAWVLGRHRRRLHLGLVAAAFGLLYLSGAGLEFLLTEWTPLGEGSPALTAARSLTSLLTTPMVLLLLSAPLAYHGRFFPLDGEAPASRPERVDLERVHDHGPGAVPDGSRTGTRTVALVAAALILPPLIAPAVVAADPFGVPEVASEPLDVVGLDEHRIEMWSEEERTVVSLNGRTVQHVVCDPDCAEGPEHFGHYGFGPLAQAGGSYVYPQWQEHQHETEDENEQYAPHEDSGLYLHVCEEPGECDDPGVQVRPFGDSQHDIDAVTAPVGDELVVVSHVRSYDYDEIPFAEDGDEAGLRAHVCADLDCADPVAIDLPEELSTNAFLANGHHLDLEPLGDGFLLTVTDAGFGSVHAVYCPDTSCADMEVTELSGDRFAYENESGLRTLVGARARERADGTAVIMLREAGEGSVRVLDCEDPACSEYGEATVTDPGWLRPVPGFDLDTQERPQLVTYDYGAERLVLISCLDGGCSETVETLLVGFEETPQTPGLAMDGHDRPHIVWGEGAPRAFTGGYDVQAEYLVCEDPWCGADLGTQVDGEQAR